MEDPQPADVHAGAEFPPQPDGDVDGAVFLPASAILAVGFFEHATLNGKESGNVSATEYDADAREWRGINPDGTPDELMLQKITTAIVDAVQPRRVILFGSAARGRMNEKSDFDLLVIKDGEHYRAVTTRIHMSLPACTRKVDLVVASTRDVERHRHKPYYVIEPALREGRVLYEQATHA